MQERPYGTPGACTRKEDDPMSFVSPHLSLHEVTSTSNQPRWWALGPMHGSLTPSSPSTSQVSQLQPPRVVVPYSVSVTTHVTRRARQRCWRGASRGVGRIGTRHRLCGCSLRRHSRAPQRQRVRLRLRSLCWWVCAVWPLLSMSPVALSRFLD